MLRNLVAPLVLVLAISVLPLGSPASAATTLVVDDDGMASITDCNATTPAYPTISAAVAAASPGDTIMVCPGFYSEMVNVNKDRLDLRGAHAGMDARNRSNPINPLTESIIDNACGPVQITADQDILDGFTVQGSTLPDPCFLAGIWMNPGGTGSNGGPQILNNVVQNNISGIELDSSCTYPTLVQFNLIQNNSNPGNGSGNGIQTNFGLCGAAIDKNKFSGDTSNSVLVVAPSSGLTVTNNDLVAGTPEDIAFANVSNATVSSNTSTGSTSTGTIDLFGGDSQIMITSNTLLRGIRAIVVENPYGVGPNTDVTAHQNCIQGNTGAGMEVDSGAYPVTPHLNATSNWWGSASGPKEVPGNMAGTGDTIIDPDHNVDFFPWLLNPPPAPCPQLPPPNTPGKATGGGKIQSDPTGLDLVLDLATLLIQQSSSPTSVG